MIKKLRTNFKDSRGDILDIFVNKPKDHCTLVTFNKGSVRGNHFHKKSIQYTFILSGKLIMYEVKVNKNGEKIGRIKKEIVSKNYLISHEKYVAHTFKALKKSAILAFVDGIRGGKNYENDTVRLNFKLFK